MRRILSILLLFGIVVVTFLEAMLWLLKEDIGISVNMLNLGVFAAALLALFILTGSSKKSDRQNKIVIKDDKDSLMITENAIIQLVRNSLDRIPAILDSEIRVGYSKEKKLFLSLALILEADSKITEITGLVEQYVHESFATILEEKVEKIEVTIKGFRPANNS